MSLDICARWIYNEAIIPNEMKLIQQDGYYEEFEISGCYDWQNDCSNFDTLNLTCELTYLFF